MGLEMVNSIGLKGIWRYIRAGYLAFYSHMNKSIGANRVVKPTQTGRMLIVHLQ